MYKKWSTNLIPFGGNMDRFVVGGYQESLPINKRLEAAAQIEGLKAVELHYPGMINKENLEEIKRILASLNLECSLVSPSISGEAKWAKGALSNLDRNKREEVIKRIKDAMDLSITLMTYKINLWPGLDGYDYPLQVNYSKKWDTLITAIKEFADYNPSVKISIEYKFKEPRNRCFISDVGKLLYLIEKVDRDNVGATLDFGHSIMALEDPAEAVTLLLKEGKLFHIHLNDTWGDWDWDMIAGGVHIYEYIEFFFWLKELNYEGWCSFDLYPSRENPQRAISESIKNLEKFIEIADKIERKRFLELLEKEDTTELIDFIRGELF
jgi:xylose isomerase